MWNLDSIWHFLFVFVSGFNAFWIISCSRYYSFTSTIVADASLRASSISPKYCQPLFWGWNLIINHILIFFCFWHWNPPPSIVNHWSERGTHEDRGYFYWPLCLFTTNNKGAGSFGKWIFSFCFLESLFLFSTENREGLLKKLCKF